MQVKKAAIGLFLVGVIGSLGFLGYSFSDVVARGLWKIKAPDRIILFLVHKDAGLPFSIGSHYLHTDDYSLGKAKNFYTRAYTINSAAGRINYQLGRVAFLESDFETAKKYLDREIELYPDFARSYYMRGLVNGYAGRYQDAIHDFEGFIKRDPSSWAGYNDLAWIYFKLGNYGKVHELAEKGLEIKPDNVWLLTALGVAQLNMGEKTWARQTLEKAERLANGLTPQNWIAAYPANDPRLASQGLAELRSTIQYNLGLVVDK